MNQMLEVRFPIAMLLEVELGRVGQCRWPGDNPIENGRQAMLYMMKLETKEQRLVSVVQSRRSASLVEMTMSHGIETEGLALQS